MKQTTTELNNKKALSNYAHSLFGENGAKGSVFRNAAHRTSNSPLSLCRILDRAFLNEIPEAGPGKSVFYLWHWRSFCTKTIGPSIGRADCFCCLINAARHVFGMENLVGLVASGFFQEFVI